MRERQRVVERVGRGQAAGSRRRAAAVAGALAAAAALSLAGCAKMDQSLGRQWMTVDFSPNTPTAVVVHVRATCSHIQNTPPLPLPGKHSVINIMYGVAYDTTNSTPAELAELQICLGKFKSVVLGVQPQDAGGNGG